MIDILGRARGEVRRHRSVSYGIPGYTRQKGWCVSLLEELSEIIGLQVYTQNGVFLGNVNNLVVDVDNGAVDGIFIGETNPLLVEGSRAVSVPYRWVQSVGDIVVLRYFPKRVSLRKGSAPPPMPAAKVRVVSKQEVIRRGLTQDLFPPKTTRHTLSVSLPERPTNLEDLI